ncbi:MAG: hypothetical protein ACRYGG_03120 [Janthinobacterium lividum]
MEQKIRERAQQVADELLPEVKEKITNKRKFEAPTNGPINEKIFCHESIRLPKPDPFTTLKSAFKEHVIGDEIFMVPSMSVYNQNCITKKEFDQMEVKDLGRLLQAYYNAFVNAQAKNFVNYEDIREFIAYECLSGGKGKALSICADSIDLRPTIVIRDFYIKSNATKIEGREITNYTIALDLKRSQMRFSERVSDDLDAFCDEIEVGQSIQLVKLKDTVIVEPNNVRVTSPQCTHYQYGLINLYGGSLSGKRNNNNNSDQVYVFYPKAQLVVAIP